jgi:hypothetical protein
MNMSKTECESIRMHRHSYYNLYIQYCEKWSLKPHPSSFRDYAYCLEDDAKMMWPKSEYVKFLKEHEHMDDEDINSYFISMYGEYVK